LRVRFLVRHLSSSQIGILEIWQLAKGTRMKW